jgi:hypothetical protein
MRNLLAFLGGAVVVFVGLGWYLGWYRIDHEAASPGHSRLQIDIDRDKFNADTQKGIEKAKEAIGSALDSNQADPPKPAPPPAVAAEPKPNPPPPAQEPLRYFFGVNDPAGKPGR